jgi:hypothetical protein
MDRPQWATFFHDLGELMAKRPPAQPGDRALRVVLSVPTGRFTYWFAASGALSLDLDRTTPVVDGAVYATWVGGKMQDEVAKLRPDGSAQLGPGIIVPAGFPMLRVPDDAPDGRRAGRADRDYRDALRTLPGRRHNWHTWFASKCLSPVVVIGTGREHLQRQRETILDIGKQWFDDESQRLLDDDSTSTSNPDRMLFYPYMVFSPSVGASRPWLRELNPRLVVFTSWTSRQRASFGLFAGAPHVIICNRRVVGTARAFPETEDEHLEPSFEEEVLRLGPPGGVYVRVFSEVVPDHTLLADDDDEEEFL